MGFRLALGIRIMARSSAAAHYKPDLAQRGDQLGAFVVGETHDHPNQRLTSAMMRAELSVARFYQCANRACEHAECVRPTRGQSAA